MSNATHLAVVPSDGELVQCPLHERAKQVLAEYRTVDEVKDFRDKAVAVQAYAKQANDFQLEIDAATARIRAERRCGELLIEMKRSGELANAGDNQHTVRLSDSTTTTKTLPELGITRDQSSKWQGLAKMEEAEFEAAVNIPGAKPSTDHVLKSQKEESAPAMDPDALWFWARLIEMQKRGLFDKSIPSLCEEWTPGMKEKGIPAIHELTKWVCS